MKYLKKNPFPNPELSKYRINHYAHLRVSLSEPINKGIISNQNAIWEYCKLIVNSYIGCQSFNMIWCFIWQKVKYDCTDIQMLLQESSLRMTQFVGIEFWGDEMTTINYRTKIVYTYFIAYQAPKITYSEKGSLNDKFKFIQSVVYFCSMLLNTKKVSWNKNHHKSLTQYINVDILKTIDWQ